MARTPTTISRDRTFEDAGVVVSKDKTKEEMDRFFDEVAAPISIAEHSRAIKEEPKTIEMKVVHDPVLMGETKVIEMRIVNDPVEEQPYRFTRVGSFIHDADRPTHLYWGRYCDWRRTKCASSKTRGWLDELNQATHEMVGEAAELTIMFLESGFLMFADDARRSRLLDEAGDVLFCAAWALDAWGFNPLRAMGESEGAVILGPESLEEEARIFQAINEQLAKNGSPSEDVNRLSMAYEQIMGSRLLILSAQLGSTSNALKKMLYQGRGQEARKQAEEIVIGLSHLQRLLLVNGFTLSQALKANIEKLDKRYPEGHTPDGGNRTRKGVEP